MTNMSFIDTGIEIFTPEAYSDLKTGIGKVGKGIGKAVDVNNRIMDGLGRGVDRTMGEAAEGLDMLHNSKLGRVMDLRSPNDPIKPRDEQFKKITESFQKDYSKVSGKPLSESEAVNVLEDTMEQFGYHMDDIVSPGVWFKVASIAMSLLTGEPIKSVATLGGEFTEKDETPSTAVSSVRYSNPGVRKKNIPTMTNEFRKAQISKAYARKSANEPITL